MNAEYHWLKDLARQCWEDLESVAEKTTLNSPVDAAGCEERLVEMGFQLASLAIGMVLVRSVADKQAKERDQKFIKAHPKKFHLQGKRSFSVSLRAGVKVSLSVRHNHRLKDPSRSRRNDIGAAWIGKRVPKLIAALGLKDEQVQQLIEY